MLGYYNQPFLSCGIYVVWTKVLVELYFFPSGFALLLCSSQASGIGEDVSFDPESLVTLLE